MSRISRKFDLLQSKFAFWQWWWCHTSDQCRFLRLFCIFAKCQHSQNSLIFDNSQTIIDYYASLHATTVYVVWRVRGSWPLINVACTFTIKDFLFCKLVYLKQSVLFLVHLIYGMQDFHCFEYHIASYFSMVEIFHIVEHHTKSNRFNWAVRIY